MQPINDFLFDRVNHQHIDKVFSNFADPSSHQIPKESFRHVLQEMGITTTPEKENELFKEADINEDGGLDKEEFIRVNAIPAERAIL